MSPVTRAPAFAALPQFATDEALRDFARHVHQIAEVLECHMVAGGFDFLLKARVANMTAYCGSVVQGGLPLTIAGLSRQ